jgi:hypothetical protein
LAEKQQQKTVFPKEITQIICPVPIFSHLTLSQEFDKTIHKELALHLAKHRREGPLPCRSCSVVDASFSRQLVS